MSAEADGLAEAWIERDDNRAQWRRLIDAVDLSSGFSLFVAIVPNSAIGRALVESLGSLAEAVQRAPLIASVDDQEPAIRRLLDARHGRCLAVMDTIGGGSRPSLDELRIALMQINQRRDVVAARLDGPLFLIVDDEGRQALIEFAPDLWSIRVAEFRFRSGRELELGTTLGRWLSADELAGMLGLSPGFGEPMKSDMASLEVPIPASTEPIGSERELEGLRALSLGSKRIITDRQTSERRNLVARFVAEYGARWERVVWLDAADERVSAVFYSVLLALRPDVPPPCTAQDLLFAHGRETGRQRALIVVENADLLDIRLLEPGAESFAIEMAFPPDRSTIAPREWLRSLLALGHGQLDSRSLRAVYAGVLMGVLPWSSELAVLIEPITAVLLPCERAGWLATAARHSTGDSAIELFSAALRHDLACRDLDQLYARLHELATVIERGKDPARSQLLARATLDVGLHLGDRRQVERSLATDLGLDRARVNRFARAWAGIADPLVEPTDDLATALAVTLYAGVLDPELFRRAVDPDEPLPVRHFGYVGLALVAIARHAGADALSAIDGVRRTAEQWGAPLPLLRADLLEAEADESAGRPAAALTKLDALKDRLEYLGRHAPEVFRVLMQRMKLAARLGHIEALTLADECWTRVREVDQVAPAVYETLARVYLQHGNPERAKLVARRWQAAYQDDPAEMQRAFEVEGEAIEHRHQAELAELERRGRPKG